MLLNFPNALTCCNLISGCMATGAAFHGHFEWALVMIIMGDVFDFFDGMAARALGVSSPIGKELDSLADVVTFGVAPSAMIFQLFGFVQYPEWMQPVAAYMPYSAFLLAAFSALRLAKFNLDERQATSFIGLPTPANALFWASLIVGQLPFLLFSLKFKDLSWEHNKVKFIFIIGAAVIAALVMDPSAIALIILWYIALSLINWKLHIS